MKLTHEQKARLERMAKERSEKKKVKKKQTKERKGSTDHKHQPFVEYLEYYYGEGDYGKEYLLSEKKLKSLRKESDLYRDNLYYDWD